MNAKNTSTKAEHKVFLPPEIQSQLKPASDPHTLNLKPKKPIELLLDFPLEGINKNIEIISVTNLYL